MSHFPLSIAKKLLQLSNGDSLPSSSINPSWLKLLEAEEVIERIRQGRTRSTLMLTSVEDLDDFLFNRFGIRDLGDYVAAMAAADLSGKRAHDIAGDTKLRTSRTFKGFLVNVIRPVEALLNGKPISLIPREGSFTFIYDFENFILPDEVVVVGIENPENFRYVNQHGNKFSDSSVFVSRYPYSQDLRTWLDRIPNEYIHFGDIDLAGIAIFEQEYKPLLKDRARFFIPKNVEVLLSKNGSRNLYNQQYQQYRNLQSETPELQELIQIIHKKKKGLEQEGLISG